MRNLPVSVIIDSDEVHYLSDDDLHVWKIELEDAKKMMVFWYVQAVHNTCFEYSNRIE